MKPGLLAVCGLAGVWTAIAFWMPGSLDTDPVWIRRVLAVMGWWFLACGLWVYARKRPAVAGLFCLYCALSCIHWGGVIGTGSESADRLLLFFFVTFGVALAEGVFLHLALSFPKVAIGRTLVALIYLPVAAAAVVTVLSLLVPVKLSVVFPLITVGSIYGILGGLIWLLRLAGNTIDGLTLRQRVAVCAALILGWSIHLLADVGLVDFGAAIALANLSLALIPAALAWLIDARAAAQPSTAAIPASG